jgi:4-hydroxythreonine-4-phosphate dehydrogenase
VQTYAPLAITAGEPAGIGLDIILQSMPKLKDCIVISDESALRQRAQQLGIRLELTHETATSDHQLRFKPIATSTAVIAGTLDPANAQHVLACLDEALRGTVAGDYSAIVTAPLHKGVINDAGVAFTGHTEYFAEHTNSEVVMLLVAGNVRVALATTHLPLAAVAQAITRDLIVHKVSILDHDLRTKFALEKPHIAVCGLNPHAGEQGHLGREEIEIIEPALEQLREQGINVSGPHPADTIFCQHHLQHTDAVFAMYHDQGLPVLKHIGFGDAVNTTLGLPIIRTSVDHGTALDLAGSGKANAGSLLAAVELARHQVQARL